MAIKLEKEDYYFITLSFLKRITCSKHLLDSLPRRLAGVAGGGGDGAGGAGAGQACCSALRDPRCTLRGRWAAFPLSLWCPHFGSERTWKKDSSSLNLGLASVDLARSFTEARQECYFTAEALVSARLEVSLSDPGGGGGAQPGRLPAADILRHQARSGPGTHELSSALMAAACVRPG